MQIRLIVSCALALSYYALQRNTSGIGHLQRVTTPDQFIYPNTTNANDSFSAVAVAESGSSKPHTPNSNSKLETEFDSRLRGLFSLILQLLRMLFRDERF